MADEHGHATAAQAHRGRLVWVLAITGTVLAAEVVGGLLSGSFALLADAASAASLGIVLLHGKSGTPAQFARLGAALTAAGFVVSTPEMCWSKTRIFDKAFPDCLKEVDAAVADAVGERERGAALRQDIEIEIAAEDGGVGGGAAAFEIRAVLGEAQAGVGGGEPRLPDIAARVHHAAQLVARGVEIGTSGDGAQGVTHAAGQVEQLDGGGRRQRPQRRDHPRHHVSQLKPCHRHASHRLI